MYLGAFGISRRGARSIILGCIWLYLPFQSVSGVYLGVFGISRRGGMVLDAKKIIRLIWNMSNRLTLT